MIWENAKTLETQFVLKCLKTGVENPDDPSNNIQKSWTGDQYLSKNMKWEFDNMETTSFKNIEGFGNL